jgi:DNA polymerase-3 subunit alpha
LVPDLGQGKSKPLNKAKVDDPDFSHEYETNPKAREVIDYAARLEGTIRNHGLHACGVVIAPDDLVKYLPLEMSRKGVMATQFDAPKVEDIGLLKMDFLGLKNLSIIQSALRIIKKVYKDDIDISNLTLDDEKAYELLSRGDTTGVFQLESAGMKRYLKELKPSSFEDIIAMVALYRPGPMQFIPSFIKRKHGEEKITYLHSGLENSLKNTYGILVYQEQFMQISKEWAGFTGGQADTLRKAVGKKKIDLMMKVKPEFIEGAVKVGGATKELAEKFWTDLEEFANYCFNKSHAACYALIAYWTAYIKAHYPDAFMAAMMTSDAGDTDRLAIEIAECKRMGITVLAPDVNESYPEFAIVGGENTIRFGLAAVKGVGAALIDDVLADREKNGKFKSVADFARRINSTKFNKKSWEAAIKTGVFDRFGTRSDLLFNLEKIQAYGSKMQKDAASGQTDLFGALGEAASVPEPEIVPAPIQATEKEQLMWERELLGLYVSSHPLDKYDAFFEEQTHSFDLVTAANDNKVVTVGGLISSVRTILTKSGTKMAFVQLESKNAALEVIVFPNLYMDVGGKLVQDNVVKVTGKINSTDRAGNKTDPKILAEGIVVVSDEEISSYVSVGARMPGPVMAVNQGRGRGGGRGGYTRSAAASANVSVGDNSGPAVASNVVATRTPIKIQEVYKVLYVLIEDPEDMELLRKIKEVCDNYPGREQIVLVMGEKEKKALKMPFRVDLISLAGALKEIVPAECIKMK